MSDLLTQFVSLPLLPVRIGVDLVQRTLGGLFPSGGAGGPASATDTAGRRPPAPVPADRALPAAAWEPAPAAVVPGTVNRPPRATGGSRGALEHPATREERAMSCNCCGSDYCSCGSSTVDCPQVSGDRGLGGRCCVKVVQYTIVSARSGIYGSDRIIVEPTTIAFSDDMDESGFTAWVIAQHPAEIAAVPEPERRYIRVAYQVFARFAEEQPNYCESQVAALWDIARRLPPPSEEPPAGRGKAAKST